MLHFASDTEKRFQIRRFPLQKPEKQRDSDPSGDQTVVRKKGFQSTQEETGRRVLQKKGIGSDIISILFQVWVKFSEYLQTYVFFREILGRNLWA